MRAIKDFPRDCYRIFTSFSERRHRKAGRQTRRGCGKSFFQPKSGPQALKRGPFSNVLAARVKLVPFPALRAVFFRPCESPALPKPALNPRSVDSARRDCQDPDEHAKQYQRSEQRKRGMQRLKLEVGSTRETMPDGNHDDPPVARVDGLIKDILPLPGAGFQRFAGCDTPLPCQKQLR